MNVSLKYGFSFVLSSLIAFYSLSLIAYPFTHPYFKGTVFYVVELPLIALIFFSASFARKLRTTIVALAGVISGYLVGLISYLIKWAFFDGQSTHLARVEEGISSSVTWLAPIFTYCWILLPISLLIGRWLASHLTNRARRPA
jgi:hypothetical protein